jgi:small subunit ribosomal protein S13
MEKKEGAARIDEKTEKKKPDKHQEKKPGQQNQQQHAGRPPEKKPVDSNPVDANFRQLVRVSGIVLDGNKEVYRVLPKIRGIGQNTAQAMLHIMGLDKEIKLGSLTEEEITKIEENILILNKNIPAWMTNRQRDYVTGENLHLTGSELEISQREDITRQKRIKSYKGVRHILGLPVRGQRTRTSFRTGSAIGVSRKKSAQAAAAAAAPKAAGGASKGAAAPAAAPKAPAAASAEKPKKE